MSRLLLILNSILLGFCLSCNIDQSTMHPQPSDGTVILEEEGDDHINRKELYFENMHRAAPGTDWRSIDNASRKESYNKRLQQRKSYVTSSTETFANGHLEGEWFERGSNNQSGSIRKIDYDVDNNKIYAISDGGTIWKGDLSGNVWSPINEDLVFRKNILSVIDSPSGGKRILAALGKTIHYSDDDGVTWIASTGYNFPTNITTGLPVSLDVLNDADQTIYYLVYTWDNTTGGLVIWLTMSTDRGETFTQINTFPHGTFNRISMWSPYRSDKLYILDKSSTLYEVVGSTVSILNTNTNLPTNVSCQLKGHLVGNELTLYALIDKKETYRSLDYGASWTFQGNFPFNNRVWDVGIEVSLDDADILYAGAVGSYRSIDGGVNWEQVNFWGQYYSNPLIYLHADIMDFGTFYDQSRQEFTLIAHHGGMHITYDNCFNYINIGLQNLNVSQYYDVVTSPADVSYMYTGSQDQGFQRGPLANTTNPIDLEQAASGDNGHIIFSNSGQSVWQQYIGGSVSFYSNAQTGDAVANWSMPGTNPPSNDWLLPCAETADYEDNSIFMGGGNLTGGGGNYLVKLTYSGGTITASQFPYDFNANANNNGEISAIEESVIDTDRIYVATDDGTFFYTNDGGNRWAKTTSFSGPGDWYLYGASILASKLTSDLVYFAGSGYSNPAVYKSEDGGVTFTAMSNGLPNTLVIEIAANTDESLIFAATNIGPYVYSVAQDQWFEMRGLGAPMQQYTSVEYVDGEDVVRFGTFGRGVWDFEISNGCIPVIAVNESPILSGIYEGAEKVISEGQVQIGSNVIFQGEDCVELSPNFEVSVGAVFVGEIEDCDEL